MSSLISTQNTVTAARSRRTTKQPNNRTNKCLFQDLPFSEKSYSAVRHWTICLASSIQFTSTNWIIQKLTNCITLKFMPLPVPVKDYYLLQCNTVQFCTEVPTPQRTTQPFILKMAKAGCSETSVPTYQNWRFLSQTTTFPSSAVQKSFLLHASFPTNVLHIFFYSCLVYDSKCSSAVTITQTEDNQLP